MVYMLYEGGQIVQPYVVKTNRQKSGAWREQHDGNVKYHLSRVSRGILSDCLLSLTHANPMEGEIVLRIAAIKGIS